MKILILGRGFLGKEFERQGFEVGNRKYFEYHYQRAMLPNGYDVIINCIAKSDTKWCEKPENYREVINANAEIPRWLSNECNRAGVKFIHISTGCLYDSPNATEQTQPAAHCVYTLSKWMGELSLNKNDLILRPRLFYSDVPDKNNLLCKILKFEKVVYNAFDSFTCTSDIPQACLALLEANQSGVFNICSDGEASIYGLSELIGFTKPQTTIDKVRAEQGIHLVNCTMRTDKLRKFYEPELLDKSIKRCFKALKDIEK